MDGVQGLDRAKLLDQLIEAYGKLGNEHPDIKAWSEEIVTLDADNKAGLKIKYQFRQLLAEADVLKENRKFDEAKAVFDKAVGPARHQRRTEARRLLRPRRVLLPLEGLRRRRRLPEEGRRSRPGQPEGGEHPGHDPAFRSDGRRPRGRRQDQGASGRRSGPGPRQIAGPADRRPDQAPQSIPDPDLAQDIEKWSQEIMALDAENKAGLKSKYEVRVLLTEAQSRLRDQKLDEAHAVLDKALALPGLAGEPLQEVQLAKAVCYAAQRSSRRAWTVARRRSKPPRTAPRRVTSGA